MHDDINLNLMLCKEGMLAGKRKRNRREGEAEERKGWEKAAAASQGGWRLQPLKSED